MISWEFKVFVDGAELTRIINKKEKTGVLQAYRCTKNKKCSRLEYFFNKHVDYSKSVKQV